MDGTVLGIFVFAAFLGGFTRGLTGFAAGLLWDSGYTSLRRSVSILNWLLGGLTGLNGIISTVWVQLSGGPKDSGARYFSLCCFLP